MGRKEDGLSEHVSEAAEALPELIQTRDKMQADLQVVNQKVNALIGYISAFLKPGTPPVIIKMANGGQIQIGSNSSITQPPPGVQIPPNIQALMAAMTQAPSPPPHVAPAAAQPQKTPSGRAPKGLIYTQVDTLMAEGGKYTLKTLRETLKARFGHEYGPSSVHRAISRGVDAKAYKLVGNEYCKA